LLFKFYSNDGQRRLILQEKIGQYRITKASVVEKHQVYYKATTSLFKTTTSMDTVINIFGLAKRGLAASGII